MAPFFMVMLAGLWIYQDAAAQSVRPEYTVHRASDRITVDGRLDEPEWFSAPDVGPFVFPWWKDGPKEQTTAKILWDDSNLYVAFVCQDANIWAEHTQRDSPVYRDDTVEVFVAPDIGRPHVYYNIEMNVLGIFLDNFHPDGPGVRVEKDWNGSGIRISTSILGSLNDDSDRDRLWILEAAIPFENFRGVAPNAPPKPGDVWHLNLNRLGGKVNAQYSQWSASRTARPQFHAPADFGRVTFSADAPAAGSDR